VDKQKPQELEKLKKYRASKKKQPTKKRAVLNFRQRADKN